MKYKIGDKVKVIKTGREFTIGYIGINFHGKHLYKESKNEFLGYVKSELQLIKQKSKYKYSRRKGLERLGFLFNKRGEYLAPNEVNGEDVYQVSIDMNDKADVGTTTFLNEYRGITLMRYIRKAIENESLVKINM